MGGRVASMLVAEGDRADGLLFLSYPLHSIQKPEQLRDAHLFGLGCPMLFVTGDRDKLARLDLLQPVVERIGSKAMLSIFPHADHGFARVSEDDVVRVTRTWWSRLSKSITRRAR